MTPRPTTANSKPHKSKSAASKSASKPVPRQRQRAGGIALSGDASGLDETPDTGFLESAAMEREDIEGVQDWLAEPIETLPELEREIGIADWIDPQTGEPAEGQSPPHLDEE